MKMKPFKINRNTWHYKLNQKFMNDDGWTDYIIQKYWEPRHRDFCSYWRATIGRLLALAFFITTVFTVLFIVGNLVYMYPMNALWFVLVIINIVAAVVGLIGISERLKSRKQNRPEGLVSQRYRAYKSKVCPMVEYEE